MFKGEPQIGEDRSDKYLSRINEVKKLVCEIQFVLQTSKALVSH